MLLRPDDASWWVRRHSIRKWSLKFDVLIWWDFIIYFIWYDLRAFLRTLRNKCILTTNHWLLLLSGLPADSAPTRGDNGESWPRPGGYITLFPKTLTATVQVITKTLSVGHTPQDFISGVSLHVNETSGRWIQSWMTMKRFHRHKVLCCLSERVWAEVSQNNN